MNKVACFIHSTYLEEWGDEVLRYLLHYLCNHPIIYCLDFIYVNNTGLPLAIDSITKIHPKIKVINYSDDPTTFEIPTIRTMYFFATLNPDYKLLYIHTKGISRSKSEETANPVRSWVNYMLYGLVNHYEDCLRLLQVYDSMGCNELSEFSHDNPPHYSGNFWWANASYMRTLPVYKMMKKWDPEFYIIGNKKYCTNSYNIYSLFNMYEVDYKTGNYSGLMKKRFEQDVLYCKLDCFDKTSFLPLYFAIMMGKIYPGHCLIILDDVITNSNEEILYAVQDVFCFDLMNEILAKYNVTIIQKQSVSMTVDKAMWGLKPYKEVDVTQKITKQFYRTNFFRLPTMFNMNNLLDEDPIPETRKQLYLTYSINGYPLERCFDEVMIIYCNNYLLLDFAYYSNVSWIQSSNVYSSDAWIQQRGLLFPTVVVKEGHKELLSMFEEKFLK